MSVTGDPREGDFLRVSEVIAVHDAEIAARGGADGTRSVPLLESATATPMATYDGAHLYETVWARAAAYVFHLAQNQPFVDGNKRVALATGLTYLKLSGFVIPSSHDDALYQMVIGFANATTTKEELASFLERVARPV